MKIIFIIILIVLIIYLNNKKKYEHFSENIQTDINNILNNNYSADFSILNLLSNKILNIKQTNNINLTNNLKVTGMLNINTSNKSSTNTLKINNSVIFNNKNNNNYVMDIFPQYFIMIWADPKNIPKGWAICDGKAYVFDKNYNLLNTIDSNTALPNNPSSSDNITIRTPDLRGTMLQSYNKPELDRIILASNNNTELKDMNFNLRYGFEKFRFKSDYIPRHQHILATKYDNNASPGSYGFDFEQSILESTNTQYDNNMPDKYYRDKAQEFRNGLNCGLTLGLGSCNTSYVWVERSNEEMNRRKIDQWKALYPNEPLYYGSAKNNHVGTKELIDFQSTKNFNLLYKDIDIRPPTIALYYIMKLT